VLLPASTWRAHSKPRVNSAPSGGYPSGASDSAQEHRGPYGSLERQNRKKAIGGWLAFVIISFAIGGALGVRAPKDVQTYVGDSGKAQQLVDKHVPTENIESVIVPARKGGSAQAPATRAAVDDTIAAVKGQPGVYAVESPSPRATRVGSPRAAARCW
jgi:hypothetical protein